MQRHDVEKFYDELSSSYDRRRFPSSYHRGVAEAERSFIAKQMASCSGRILEVGPGTGRLTKQLVQFATSLTVCDISEKMLTQLRSNMGKIDIEMDYRQLSVDNLSELSGYGSFDAVVAMRIIPHVTGWQDALANLCGAVRPGGTLVFDLWNRQSFVGCIRYLMRRPSHVLTHRLTANEIKQAVDRLPAEVVATYRSGYPRLGPFHLDAIGSKIAPSLAYSSVFACRRMQVNIVPFQKQAA